MYKNNYQSSRPLVQNSTLHRDGDRIYYNVTMYNPNNSQKIARYSESRSEAILENASDYCLSVIRFSIPGSSIPIFFFEDDLYEIALEYQGDVYSYTLQYIPYNSQDGKYIFSYQHFVDIINDGYSNAFTALKAAHPLSPQKYAPYLTYTAETGLISLNVQKSYSSEFSPGSEITVYMSSVLYSFFESFNTNFFGFGNAGGTDFEILIKNNGNNSIILQPLNVNILNWIPTTAYVIGNLVKYLGAFYICIANSTGNNPQSSPTFWTLSNELEGYEMKQESSTLYLWNELRQIVFTTGLIPVKSEYVPTLNKLTGLANEVTNNSLKIITDFEPNSANPVSGDSFKNYLQYTPSGPYRLIDLMGTNSLTDFDINISWSNSLGTLYDYYIPPNQSVTIKLMFIKKDKVAGYSNSTLTYLP